MPRSPFTGLALWAIVGILGAEFWELPPLPVVVAAAFSAALAGALPRTATCWLFCAVAFFTLHTLRHHGSAARRLAGQLASANRLVEVAGVVWSEPEIPATPTHNAHTRFQMRLSRLRSENFAGLPVAPLLINIAWTGPPPAYGDFVVLSGTARNLAPPRNPGQFDFARYQQRHGVYSEVVSRYAGDCHILEHGKGNPLIAFALRARQWIRVQLERDLKSDPEVSTLIESMVLGLKGQNLEDLKELFQRTGTMHLFAVSGLNVAMLASITAYILKPLRVRRFWAILVIIPVLLSYALLTGLGASCVRATVMAVLVLLAYLIDRRPVLLNSLAAAAFLILAWDTNELFSPGFQFSFLLVLSMVTLAGRFQRWLGPAGRPDVFLPVSLWSWRQRVGASGWHKVTEAVGVTVAGWIGSLVLTMVYFHLFPPAALLANLVAVPLAFCILSLGLLSVLTAALSPVPVVIFNNANWVAAKTLIVAIRFCAQIPGGYFYVGWPHPAPALEATVYDLERGGASWVETGGRCWLINCGSGYQYRQVVLPHLRSQGINRLDGFFLTQGSSQYIGAALAVVEDFQPRQILDSTLSDRSRVRRSFHAALDSRGQAKVLIRRGDSLQISAQTRCEVLFPPAGFQRPLADDKALVLRIECQNVRILWMSDSGFATEQWLLENEPDLRADLVIKGSHARDLSGTTDFLLRVGPQAVICAQPGADSTWEDNLKRRGIAVFVRERTGAVTVEVSAGTFRLTGFVNAQTFLSRAR